MDEWTDPPVEPLLAEPVRPGQRLGSNYVVGERLGRGAMGVVHEATSNDGRLLAVKFLRAELASDHKTVARFLQERHIFRTVIDPNVVRVHDLVAEGDNLAIVMERVSGGDLKQRLVDRSLTPRQSVTIAAGTAAGLSAIHGASVVHRDLKPANILLTEDLVPKISDFGISRLVTEAMTRTSATIGTPIYMAPEAADQRGAEAPADVYALGIMLFELLVGRPPFSEGGTFAVLRAHAMDPVPRVDGVPTELSDLIARMLDKEPANRPDVDDVHRLLLELAPQVDEGATPVAVPAVGAGQQGFESGEVTGPPEGGPAPVPPPTGVAAAGAAVGAFAAAASTDPGASPVPSEAAEVIGSQAVAAEGASAPPVFAGASAVAGPDVSQSGFNGLDKAGKAAPADGSEPFAPATSTGTVTGGISSLFPNRVPRRVVEAGLAIGSLAAVAVVAFLIMNSGDGGSTTLGSDGDATDEVAGPGVGAEGDGSGDGPTAFANDDGEGGNSSSGSGGDDGTSGSGTGSGTSGSGTPTTTEGSGGGSTPTTPTTRTTTESTPTTPTTEQSVPIRIVSGPTVNTNNATSFQFNYSTNSACGTGSFSVTNLDTGTSVGSFAGQDTCYGPLHGGFPGLSSAPEFAGFNIEPGTTYRVSVTVRGTTAGAGDTLPTGTGSDSASFTVTTPGVAPTTGTTATVPTTDTTEPPTTDTTEPPTTGSSISLTVPTTVITIPTSGFTLPTLPTP